MSFNFPATLASQSIVNLLCNLIAYIGALASQNTVNNEEVALRKMLSKNHLYYTKEGSTNSVMVIKNCEINEEHLKLIANLIKPCKDSQITFDDVVFSGDRITYLANICSSHVSYVNLERCNITDEEAILLSTNIKRESEAGDLLLYLPEELSMETKAICRYRLCQKSVILHSQENSRAFVDFLIKDYEQLRGAKIHLHFLGRHQMPEMVVLAILEALGKAQLSELHLTLSHIHLTNAIVTKLTNMLPSFPANVKLQLGDENLYALLPSLPRISLAVVKNFEQVYCQHVENLKLQKRIAITVLAGNQCTHRAGKNSIFKLLPQNVTQEIVALATDLPKTPSKPETEEEDNDIIRYIKHVSK